MEPSADLRLCKTDKGQQELRERRFGLSARARQVLILIDGRRSCGDLARLLPENDVLAFVALLEGEGFVEPVRPGAAGPGAASAAGTTPARTTAAPAATSPAAADGLFAARARAVRALIDTTGPHGDAMAMRFERCRSAQELRELLPSAAAIVEAVAGREAARRFAERVGLD